MSDTIEKMKRIQRTSLPVRICHWLMVICFAIVALSGLSWFFPYLGWFNNILFTPQLARVVHPFLGILVFIGLAFMFVRLYKYNLITSEDKQWLKYQRRGYSQDNNPIKVGKYNIGQKILFWLLMLCIVALLMSGIVIWRAYFAEYFPIPMIRLGLLIHSFVGFGMICLVLGHIYLAYYIKGTLDSMTKGDVALGWAKKHHNGWYEQEVKEYREQAKR